VVAQDADLRGNITLGAGQFTDGGRMGRRSQRPADLGVLGSSLAGCVVHPRSTLLAMSGPIVIGDKCIIEENVVIVNR